MSHYRHTQWKTRGGCPAPPFRKSICFTIFSSAQQKQEYQMRKSGDKRLLEQSKEESGGYMSSS